MLGEREEYEALFNDVKLFPDDCMFDEASRKRKRERRVRGACLSCARARTKCDVVCADSMEKCRRCDRLGGECMFKTLNSVDGGETIHIGTDHKKKASTETASGGMSTSAAMTDLKYLNDKAGTPAELLREFMFAAMNSSDLSFLGKVMIAASAQGFNVESLIGGASSFAALVGLVGSKVTSLEGASAPVTRLTVALEVQPIHITALPPEAAWTHDNG